MRFLLVLALIKCALPICNSMNVDIDVSVDINAGAGSQDQCIPKGGHCSRQMLEKCCPPLTCLYRPHDDDQRLAKKYWCDLFVIPPSQGDCIKTGQKCKRTSECCELPHTSQKCVDPTGLGRPKICLQGKKECNANEGERCTSDEDCCEKDNTCSGIGPFGEYFWCKKKSNEQCKVEGERGCHTKPDDCCKGLNCWYGGRWTECVKPNKCKANEGEYCTKDEDCCEKDNTCESHNTDDHPELFTTTCTYKPKDCIEDGEPCHGTDDWTHECCSKSCCEGKCGTCGYTPWYKRF